MPGTNSTGGFSFGQPQTAPVQSTNKSLFGTTTATSSGFNFGTGAAQPQQPVTSSTIGFGAGNPAGGFSLGQPAATSAPGSGFSFSATTPAAPTTTTSGFSFGVTSTTTAPSTGGFALSGSSITPVSTTTTTTTTTTGFSFGTTPAAATTTAAATPGFSLPFGATAISTPAVGFSSGIGCLVMTTAGSTTTAPTTSLGLGGAQPPSASADANNSGSKTSGKSTKDQQLSQDLFATIAVFESRKNAENASSEENIRQTAAPFHKIGEKAKEIQKVLAEIASDHLQLQANTSNLKGEVMKEAEHVEMAKRTKETPMALQGDNKAPEVFFINLVRSFEAEMMYFRTKIEEVSQCMQAASNPCETEEDIAEVLQREHDTLKDLASKVYAKHSQLVELSHLLKTKAVPNEQEFFRPQTKENTKTPASSVVRPVLGGGGSGLLAFQEQQQRAKAVTLGAAPPTLPLAHSTTPSMFSGGSTFGPCFGNSSFGLGTGFGGPGNTSSTFGTKPLFGSTTNNFGNTNTTPGLQQSNTSGLFTINSPFNTKPFGS